MSLSEIDTSLSNLSLSDLDALIARAAELRDQRRVEAMDRLKKDAELLGASVIDANGKKRRRPRSKREE